MHSTELLSTAQAAAWLQLRIDRDETAFGRRAGAVDALSRLRAASEAVVHRVRGDRVDLLLGRRLGGVALAPPHDEAAVQDFVARFYRDYRALFSASAFPAGSLRVERVRSGSTTVAEVRQHIGGIPVADARWTLIFDRAGHLTHVTGAPFDPARITVEQRPGIDAEQAVELALRHESLERDDVDASTQLAIEGRTNQLMWTVELKGRRRPSLFPELAVDAHRRTVVARGDRCEHGVVAIPVRHYSHPGGIKDSTGITTVSNINVDVDELNPPKGLPSLELFSLQRLGSGRSRIWNAKPTGADPSPQFTRTVEMQADYFVKSRGTTTDNVFNEQQTYYWAQTLKTDVDEWGREPNAYGHYPVDPSRAINVEVVVNGDAAMEDDWSTDTVMHGYFRRTAPRSWFVGHPSSASEVPAVFLFNSAGNSASPQFFGPEYSGSYSIIAHEVGHFISWQYGDWSGPSGTKLAGSLNEGHSMVLAALLGKQEYGAALEYDESAYVATGGRPDGTQWAHISAANPALRYSALDCVTADPYYLARPFAQAMWRLMNNVDSSDDPIWSSADAAIANTADLFMHSLHSFTADSTMTWDKLCLALLARVYERIADGLEQGALPETYCGVYRVFSANGLLTECVNSP
jgi:hypothetical protein